MKKIKVLIVDDSAVIRAALTKILSKDQEIEVVSTAPNPYIAIEKIKKYKPDVLTLDIEMPKMDGLTFLEKLMNLHPMPVIMISTWTYKNSEKAIKSLSLGAFDFIEKPKNSNMIEELEREIILKVKSAAKCSIGGLRPITVTLDNAVKMQRTSNINLNRPDVKINKTNQIILIGASTGGTLAIEDILKKLPQEMPGIVIVQHMPANFTKAFADRLDSLCKLHIKEAQDGEAVENGTVYIAPGGKQCYIQKGIGRYKILIRDDEPVNRHKPSVDALFFSAARYNCSNVLGVMLTGMGKDGAKGMLAMRESGSYNIAQDEDTSIVYGMPKEAAEIGAVHEIHRLNRIAERLINITR